MPNVSPPEGTPEVLTLKVVVPSNAHSSITEALYRHQLLVIPYQHLLKDKHSLLDPLLPTTGMVGTIFSELEQNGIVKFSELVPLWSVSHAEIYASWFDFFANPDETHPTTLSLDERVDYFFNENANDAWKFAIEYLPDTPR